MRSSRKNSSAPLTNVNSNLSSVEFLRVCSPSHYSFLPPRPTHSLLLIVDVDDWAKFTDYRGYSTEDQVIKWFWQCIRSWPAERRSRLLQFATGTNRIPVGGFKDLQGPIGLRRFTIEKSGDPSRFPMANVGSNRVGGLD